jgi:CheY-like chemotaxis protein
VDRQRLVQLVRRYVGDSQRRVLVVDDDADAREVASRMLSGAGFEVREAVDGAEALVEIREHPPDLILLDLMMPVMDGFEVVNALSADPDFHIPILVLTAKQLTDEDRARLALGARSILSKGRDLRLMLSRMTDLLTE